LTVSITTGGPEGLEFDALRRAGWHSISAGERPGRRWPAYDAVVVGRGGVFVVVHSTWRAWRSQRLADADRGRHARPRRAFGRIERAAWDVWQALAKVCVVDVVPVICLHGRDGVVETVGETVVCSPDALPRVLQSFGTVLSEADVAAAVETLETRLDGPGLREPDARAAPPERLPKALRLSPARRQRRGRLRRLAMGATLASSCMLAVANAPLVTEWLTSVSRAVG